MSEFLTVAIHAEGSTDYKLFKPILQRTIEDIILNCDKDIELYPIVEIRKEIGKSYIEDVEIASKSAYESGIKCLILHCDSDNNSIDNVMSSKITPAIESAKNNSNKDKMCLNLIPLVPIYMSEAWILADIELLKQEIDAERISNFDLGLSKQAESFSDPKRSIEDAIRIAQEEKTRRHRSLKIADLYVPLGQKIPLTQLKKLSSYQKFYDDLTNICLPYCL